MTTHPELKKTMFEAAAAAREVLLTHFGRLESIDKKGDDETNLVTIADRQAEEAVIGTIQRRFPNHAFLGEESGARGSSEAEFCWVIDPLDGTTNFAHGMPIFAISIGLQQNGETILGLVVDVTRDEWFFAEKGGGAFLNDRPIHVSKVPTLGESLIITGFPHGRRRNIDHFMKMVGGILMRCQSVTRLGSAAIDLCYAACGRSEGFWQESLQPWDVAAGNLIVEEAGGRVTNFANIRSGILDKEFVASNALIHDEFLAVLKEHWEKW